MNLLSKMLSLSRVVTAVPPPFYTSVSEDDSIDFEDFYASVGVVLSIIPALLMARAVKDGGLDGLLDFMKRLNRRRIKSSYRFNASCNRFSLKSNHVVFFKKRTNKK